ncbi:helix-hairpin-helix domain-containing protein [Oceanobacillus kimchii]|uniref:helix-hairpin-helix domain-containing protein n=1 Tax=Oceanobacillus kimchii TaxID=746691 RepID=UPI00233006E9|nr:helix-hairpin-helix domain-containing protein [Oceanobacillus kimchii]
MGSNTKLPLTSDEKVKLRKAKVKIMELHSLKKEHIAEILEVSLERARVLKGLADFQSVPSIGAKLAEKLVFELEVFSLSEVKEKNAPNLFDELEQELGVWTDSCVEDQLRCVIHFANNPDSKKQWFDFTEERKSYRNKVGFSKNRPIIAWYE